MAYIKKENKTVQSVIAWSETVPTAVEKWNKKFEELNWRDTFAKCHKVLLAHSLDGFRPGSVTPTIPS